jgi:tRNA pseudouridine38/39 synthase
LGFELFRPMENHDILKVNANSLSKEDLVKLIEKYQKEHTPKQKKHKKEKVFDISKWNMRQIAFKVSYIGWNYNGFASQTTIKTTVEEEIFNAFEKTKLIKDRSECNYSRCGRTDKGVSGLGQVISLLVRTNLHKGIGIENPTNPPQSEVELDYMKMLNACLPKDIRVLGWAPVPIKFNARFNALWRKYKYYFIKEDMDIDLMNQAAQQFIGSHDFRNLCKINGEEAHFLRKMISIKIVKAKTIYQGDGKQCIYEIVIKGWSFLWHQVRCMTAVLFLIGKKLENPDIIPRLLDVENTTVKPQYTMANEFGLVLYNCAFDEIKQWNSCNTTYGQNWIEETIYEEFSKNTMLTTLWSTIFLKYQKMDIVDEQGTLVPWGKVKDKVVQKKRHIDLAFPTPKMVKKE